MDGFDPLLANLPGLGAYGGFVVLLILAVRMAAKSDSRYNAEVRDHEQTQRALDEERHRRRNVEEQLGEVRQEVRQLRAEVAALRRQIAGGT